MHNVLMITCDSLRPDFIGSWQEDNKKLTPNIDRFAKESTVFKNAFSHAPYTWGSFASLFTSKYTDQVTYPSRILKDNHPTISEILGDAGYQTIGIHSNPFLSRHFKYDRGFSQVKENIYPWNPERFPVEIHRKLSGLYRMFKRQPYLSATDTNERIFNSLNQAKKPFFLWALYMDTHGPYLPKGGLSYSKKIKSESLWQKAVKSPNSISDKEREELLYWYREEVSYLDHHFGNLYDFLEKKELLDETIIVFCADHGDGFFEHGFYSHPRYLYDELIHVPLIMKIPDHSGKDVSDVVSLVDVVPTILDLLELDNKFNFDGQSLMPRLNENKNVGRGFAISDATPGQTKAHISIRSDKWKLIINENTGESELYDLVDDPLESINLYNGEDETIGILKGLLEKNHPRKIGETQQYVPAPELDGEITQRLRDLGYL